MSALEIEVGDLRPSSVAFTETELVVTPADGRRSRRVARALAMLRGKTGGRKHDNLPP